MNKSVWKQMLWGVLALMLPALMGVVIFCNAGWIKEAQVTREAQAWVEPRSEPFPKPSVLRVIQGPDGCFAVDTDDPGNLDGPAVEGTGAFIDTWDNWGNVCVLSGKQRINAGWRWYFVPAGHFKTSESARTVRLRYRLLVEQAYPEPMIYDPYGPGPRKYLGDVHAWAGALPVEVIAIARYDPTDLTYWQGEPAKRALDHASQQMDWCMAQWKRVQSRLKESPDDIQLLEWAHQIMSQRKAFVMADQLVEQKMLDRFIRDPVKYAPWTMPVSDYLAGQVNAGRWEWVSQLGRDNQSLRDAVYCLDGLPQAVTSAQAAPRATITRLTGDAQGWCAMQLNMPEGLVKLVPDEFYYYQWPGTRGYRGIDGMYYNEKKNALFVLFAPTKKPAAAIVIPLRVGWGGRGRSACVQQVVPIDWSQLEQVSDVKDWMFRTQLGREAPVVNQREYSEFDSVDWVPKDIDHMKSWGALDAKVSAKMLRVLSLIQQGKKDEARALMDQLRTHQLSLAQLDRPELPGWMWSSVASARRSARQSWRLFEQVDWELSAE